MALTDMNMSDLNVDARPWVPAFSMSSPPTSSRVSPTNECGPESNQQYTRVTKPVPYISEYDDVYHPRYSPKAQPSHYTHSDAYSRKAPQHQRVPVPHHHANLPQPRMVSPKSYSPEQRYLPAAAERQYSPPVRESHQQSVHHAKYHRGYESQQYPGYKPRVQQTPPAHYGRTHESAPVSVKSTAQALPVVSEARYVPDPADFIRQHYARLM